MLTFSCQKGHHQETTKGFQEIFLLIKVVNLWFTSKSNNKGGRSNG